jgi:surface antigen
MNPVLILTISSSTKKQISFVLAMVVIIASLPVMAVFALGSSALSILSQSSGSSESTTGLYQGPLSNTDTYAWGNCTYWAFLMRQQAGDPIPNSWGNAATWALRAALGGYLVDHTPSQGSIMQISNVDNGLGHVAYVTNVNPADGSWTISEMNVKGLDIVDTKTLPASAALGYSFIHDKVALP